MRWGAALLWILGVVTLIVFGAGCGGVGPSQVSHGGIVTASPGLVDTLTVNPYPDEGQYYRYRDMLDHRYKGSPTDGSFGAWRLPGVPDPVSYAPGLVTYQLSDGPTLMGSITADGVKPNFAYQVKLEGMPSQPYPWKNSPDSIENWSNSQIGSVGRWWCATCGWNVSDAQLRRHRNHWIVGYLLFDFFMTDINGDATRELCLDSSFHVVWRTNQRSPNPAADGAPRQHTVTYSADVYEQSFTGTDVWVYAEGESGRPKPGEVSLPAGDYLCRLLLTEESFHNVPPALQSEFPWGYTNYADGGFWAHALSDDAFAFTITSGGPSTSKMHVASIDMALDEKPRFARANATVTVVDENGSPVPEATVSGQWSGLTGDTDAAATDSSGECTVTSDRTSGSSGTFTFTVDDVTKEGWTYDQAANVETSDSISF